ncbi:MAG: methyltransferase [Coriobacteriia bacterium]|nr:methyltransferase [Coriobacteriia bacterium]
MERVPFDNKEIENATETPGFMPGSTVKTFDTPISPKENYKLLYDKKVPFWLPGFSDMQTITPRIDPDNLARVFSFEAQPMTAEDRLPEVRRPDKFGIPWVYVEQVSGSIVEPGSPTLLDANDWPDVIQFPDVSKWDWEASAEANKEFVKTEKFLVYSHLTGYFERLISFMDFENAAVALVDPDQKEAVKSLMNALADLYIDIFTRAMNAYNFDGLNVHDDWGAQRAPFFSLDVCMEMIVPAIKKVVDFAHNELNVPYDFHSCGKNELLVPAYIAAGTDSWGGQNMNDKAMLYDKYGDKIILGIEPDITVDFAGPPVTLEAAIAAGQKFLDTYIPNFKDKPVTMGFFFGPEGYNEYMYEASRNAFNAIA